MRVKRPKWSQAALAAALAVIALVCLPPTGAVRAERIDLCLLCGADGGASTLLNVALFVPLGVALGWRGCSLARVIATGALVSFGVEVLQYFIPGRHTELSDLVANTAGAALGGALVTRPRHWLMPRGTPARVATVGVAVAACAPMVLAGSLFRPSAPPGPYYGQWTSHPLSSPFEGGVVLDARIGRTPLPSARIADSAGIRSEIAARRPVTVRFVLGAPTRSLTPVFRLVAGPYDAGVEALQVAVDGRTLVLTPRFRADDYRLARPEVQLPDALDRVAAGDTLAITLRARTDHGYDVQVGDRPPVLVGFTVGRGWSLLHTSFVRSETMLRIGDLAWLLALATVVGWFAVGGRGAIVAAAALVATAFATPRMTDLLPTPVTLHLTLAAGVGLGWRLRRAAESRWPAQRREGAQSS